MAQRAGSARTTVRRAATRRRLLEAALEVFAETGFGRATVEQVCEHAGFTRGAFYSNFASLDELFLAMWEERSTQMIADLRAALAEVDPAAEKPEDALRAALAAVPVDGAWFRVTAEFTAHALRNPPVRRVVVARERAIQEALLPIVVDVLGRAGRRVLDEAALGQALVAVHDGTLAQVLLDLEDPAAPRRREALFLHVLNAYSTPATEESP